MNHLARWTGFNFWGVVRRGSTCYLNNVPTRNWGCQEAKKPCEKNPLKISIKAEDVPFWGEETHLQIIIFFWVVLLHLSFFGVKSPALKGDFWTYPSYYLEKLPRW